MLRLTASSSTRASTASAYRASGSPSARGTRSGSTASWVTKARALSFGARSRSSAAHCWALPAPPVPPQAAISSLTAACRGAVKASGPMASNAGPHSAGRWMASLSASRSTWITGSPRS